MEECRNDEENSLGDEKHIDNNIGFTEGDLVLLRHLETKTSTDEPSPWWYGPFTIKNLNENGMVSLVSKRGGEVTASVERLRYHNPGDGDYIYQGYVVMRDEVT